MMKYQSKNRWSKRLLLVVAFFAGWISRGLILTYPDPIEAPVVKVRQSSESKTAEVSYERLLELVEGAFGNPPAMSEFEHEHVGFNPGNRDRWITQKAATVAEGAIVLDAGAGPMPYKNLFSHYRPQEFLKADEVPRSFRKNSDGGFEVGGFSYKCDITDIPEEDATFDAILCTEVFEHIPEPMMAMKEFSRLLKPGGRLFITAPFTGGSHQDPYHFSGGYSLNFYNEACRRYGMEVVETMNQGTPNDPAGTQRRLGKRGVSAGPGGNAEERPAGQSHPKPIDSNVHRFYGGDEEDN
jgi:SAM-dependent methyltransferase